MRPASPSMRPANASAAQTAAVTTSILYNTTAAAAPPPYTLLPPAPHSQPLRYPVAFWSAPPSHRIAAIASSSAQSPAAGTRYVYTGSVEGHIVQWEPLSSSKQQQQPAAASPTAASPHSPPSPSSAPSCAFRPRLLSFRHGSASVTALCCVPYLSSFLVCAATSEGFLSAWSPSGQCLASSFALPFHATALLPLHSLPSYMASSSYVLAASSHSPYLYLYSLPSVHPVLLLGHEADGSGIVGVCSITKRARNRAGEEKDGTTTLANGGNSAAGAVEEREMVCSVSASGLITVWDINNKLKKQRDKRAPYPFFSFSTFQSSVLSSSPSASLAPLSITPATAALCLALTSSSVAVVSTLSLSVLCLVSLADRGWGVGDGVTLVGLECGSVVQSGDDSVLQLVLTTSGRVVLIVRLACHYERKRRKDGKVDERCICEPTLDAVLPLDEHRRNKPINSSPSSTRAGVLLPASAASCVRVVDEHVMVGHEGGEVTVYALPSSSLGPPQSAATVLLPSFYTCLAFAFPHLSLASLLSPPVTCSHLFLSSFPPFLFQCAGHADGRLHVSSLTSSSSSSSSAPAADIDFTVSAHSSAVRCMLDVEVRGAAGCQRLLATAGDDGSVCIWKVEERRCRARFHSSSPVVALMQLTSTPSSSSLLSSASSAYAFPVTPSTAAASWTLPCLLFVVCACNTIKIYSLLDFSLVSTLPSHASPPVSLTLPSASSDQLLVLTACGSLYLWAMSVGQLLGVVEGQAGRMGEDRGGGVEGGLERRGGGRAGDVRGSELAMACARARDELKAKRDAERDSKRLNGRRGSVLSAATSTSAFTALSSSPFLLSALSSLSASTPLTLPSLTPIPLSPSLRTQQTELVQLLSTLFPSAPLQALEKERKEQQADATDEEKELSLRQRERDREREDERIEVARERAKEIERDRMLDEQRTQQEAEDDEQRRREAAGIPPPPTLEVLNWATGTYSLSSAVSSCVSVAVLDVPALVEQLQTSYPHSIDEQQDESSSPDFTYLRSILSLLFDWDSKGNIDGLLRDQLQLPPPRPSRSFAQLSCDDSAVSVLFPSHAYSYRRWQVGEEWSGSHALTVSALCMALLSPPSSSPASPPPSHAAVSKLLSYYTTSVLDTHKHHPPSLTQLLSYTLHSSPLVSTASRLLLQQHVSRLPLQSASTLSTAWGDFYDFPLSMDGIWGDWDEKDRSAGETERERDDTAVSEQELLVAQLLTTVGVRELDAKKRKRRQQQLLSDSDQFVPFSPLAASSGSSPLTEFEAKSQYITHTLLRVIARPLSISSSAASLQQQQMTALACDLLCSALSFLRIHISAPLPLLRYLLLLSVSSASSTVVSSSTRLLMECGRLAPSFFIECMGREALNSLSPPALRQSSISSLSTLLRTHPLPLSRSLPSSVHTIIRCLDPASPQLRKTMLNVTTAALYALVTLYPACSFHQQSQRFAVGCCGKDGVGGVILVYDLRTATVWRVLEGHTSDVHAVLFSRDEAGDRLVSYSATEGNGAVRVWNTEVGGWLGGLIGMSGKCVRTIKLERADVHGVLRREREVAREKARQAMEEERRDEKRREDKKTRKRTVPRQLSVHQPPLLQTNGLDSPSSSPQSLFASDSPPSSSSSVRRLATDSPALTPVVAATRTPPTAPSSSRRLPPPPSLHTNTSSSSSSASVSTSANGRLTPSPSPQSTPAPSTASPPPLQLQADGDEDAEEEVEGMGPSIGIATYHALPGAVVSSGGLAGGGGDGAGGGAGGSMQRRLLGVRLSWLSDKAVRVVREDGSVKDVQV